MNCRVLKVSGLHNVGTLTKKLYVIEPLEEMLVASQKLRKRLNRAKVMNTAICLELATREDLVRVWKSALSGISER